MKLRFPLLLAAFLGGLLSASAQPAPKKTTPRAGHFTFGPRTTIAADSGINRYFLIRFMFKCTIFVAIPQKPYIFPQPRRESAAVGRRNGLNPAGHRVASPFPCWPGHRPTVPAHGRFFSFGPTHTVRNRQRKNYRKFPVHPLHNKK